MTTPTDEDNLEMLFDYIRRFVKGRKVRVLTRMANSSKDSHTDAKLASVDDHEEGTVHLLLHGRGHDLVAATHFEPPRVITEPDQDKDTKNNQTP